MKDYKVEAFDIFGKTKPKYFQTREKAEEYAETIQSKYGVDIFVLYRDRQSKYPKFWYAVKHIAR